MLTVCLYFPLVAVLANLLYEFVSTRFVVCKSYIRTRGLILRNFVGQRLNPYTDVGGFINKIDEFHQSIMFVNKSIIDSIPELIMVFGIILITPFQYLKYISITVLVFALLFAIVLILRRREKVAFKEMNEGRSEFNGNIVSLSGNRESTVGSNAIQFGVSLLDRASRFSERNKNDCMIVTGLQQTILARAYLLPVFMMLFIITKLALPQEQISEIVLFLTLILGKVIFLASSVVDAVVSLRYYNDARQGLVDSPVESAAMIKDVWKIFIKISD